MKVPKRYYRTLERYLRWRTGNFLRPVVELDHTAPTAAELMFNWESNGKPLGPCSEPTLLADYVQGKQSRDWHITEWKDGVKRGYFMAEEFLWELGLDAQEFESVFGHAPREFPLRGVILGRLAAIKGTLLEGANEKEQLQNIAT